MVQLTDLQRYLVHEFVKDYRDGRMSRRDMVSRILHITGGVAATATVLTALGVAPATRAAYAQPLAQEGPTEPQSPISVPADDPRVIAEDITFPGSDGATIMAYQAQPSGASGATPVAATPEVAMASPVGGGVLPIVLICHENRGLTDHIRDVTRRYAVEGYLACAVDLLSREGGTAAMTDPSAIPGALTDADPTRHVGDFQSAIAFYGGQSFADVSRVAMTGYCFGGGITWRTVTQTPELKAAAPYYGPPPPLEDVPNITAAVLGVYSDDPEDFANEGRDDLETALQAAGITYQINVYPDTEHAFHNDTGDNYNEEQALAAWNDTLAWFAQYV